MCAESTKEFSMGRVRLNGIDMYYEVSGEGSPLLLIAGLASDSKSWVSVLPALQACHRVIVFDNRGVGRTVPQDAPTSIQQMTDDCVALLKHLNVPRVHVVGHSMGGQVAMDLAIRYPSCVGKLVLAATSASLSERNKYLLLDWCAGLSSGMDRAYWFRTLFYWIFSPAFFADNGQVDGAIEYALDYPYPQSNRAFVNQVDALVNYECDDYLAQIRAPTIVLGGSQDIFFTADEIAHLASTIPDAQCSFVEHAAHSIMMEAPGAFAEKITTFLSGHG